MRLLLALLLISCAADEVTKQTEARSLICFGFCSSQHIEEKLITKKIPDKEKDAKPIDEERGLWPNGS